MIKIFEEKSKYFISEETHGEPLWENSEMQIFRQLKNTVSSPFFYQGIRVSKSEYVSDFVYNLLKPSTDLTEDRTIDSGSFKNEIGVTLYKSCENQQFLEDFFMAEEGLVETECDVNWWMTPTDAFVAATEPMLALTNSQSLKSWLLNRKPLSEQFDLREADENEQLRIDKGLAFLEAANYKVTCQIMVTDSPTAGALAMALPDTDTIVLTPKLFDMGMQWVVRALIEEQMHLQHKVRDHSREMQNLLFTWLIQEYEKRTGQVL